MASKRAAAFSGSGRIKSFLLGFRWFALVLGLVLMFIEAGSPAAAQLAPPPGPLAGIGWVVAIVFVVYHGMASVFMLKLVDQPVTLYTLVMLDAATGAFLTWFYGLDFFMLASGLPVLETAYLSGPTGALFVAFLIGLLDGFIVFNQMLFLVRNETRLAVIHVNDVSRVRLFDLAGYVMVELLLIWAMAAIRSEEEHIVSKVREHAEEKNILQEELYNTKKEVTEAFNEMNMRESSIGRLKAEASEANDNLEKSLKKLHEVQSTMQALQQKMVQREQQLTTAHKRETEEFKKEIEDVQRSLDRSHILLDSFLAVNGSLHRDQAVMNIIEMLMKLVPSQTCLLYTLEIQDGVQELYPDGGASPYLEFLRNYTIKPGDGAVGWVAKHREAIRIDKEQAVLDGEEVTTLVTYEKSAIVMPLEFDGRLLGVLYLGRPQATSFSQEDFDTAVQFTRLASTTFSNALMYQRTLSVGIFDDVTGIYNALYFDERLTEEVKRARRYQFSLSLILLDVDNFTRFNETYGPGEGNLLLKDMAEILKEHTRETDVLSRLENDEFAVLLVESEKSNAILIGERIRMALEVRYLGRQAAKQRIHITVSGGVASFPEESESREELVEKAAAALQTARRKGGNQIQY